MGNSTNQQSEIINNDPAQQDLNNCPVSTQQNIIRVWPTIGLTVLMIISFVAINIAVEMLLHSLEVPQNQIPVYLALFAPLAGCTALVLLIRNFTRNVGGITKYLKIKQVKLGELLEASGMFVIFFITLALTTHLLGIESTPKWQRELFAKLENWQLSVLLLSVVIAAPIWEEFLFRGFALRGLAASPLGMSGALILTSAIWASLHMNYSYKHMLVVFFFGIFLGLVRIRYNSLTPSLFLHGLNNAIACGLTILMTAPK